MYLEVEDLVDEFGWSLTEAKALSYRERKHWHRRAQVLRNMRNKK